MKYIYHLLVLTCSLLTLSVHAMEQTSFLARAWSALNEFCNADVMLETYESLNKEEIRSKIYLLFHTTPINIANIEQYIAELNDIKTNSNISPDDESWLSTKIQDLNKAIAQ